MLKHLARFMVGLFKKLDESIGSALGKIEGEIEWSLIKIKKILRLFGSKPDCVFIAGYYHTGTRWINELIRKNTPKGRIYAPRHQHRFIDDNCKVAEFGKHGEFNDTLLNQSRCIIVYMVRDYDDWIQTFLNCSYEVRLDGDIASSAYGWPSMNVYDLYCHVLKTNIKALRSSNCSYIIADLGYCRKTNGMELLELLEENGLQFKHPLQPILKHTKDSETWSHHRKQFDTSGFKRHSDTEFEEIMASLSSSFEYRFK